MKRETPVLRGLQSLFNMLKVDHHFEKVLRHSSYMGEKQC